MLRLILPPCTKPCFSSGFTKIGGDTSTGTSIPVLGLEAGHHRSSFCISPLIFFFLSQLLIFHFQEESTTAMRVVWLLLFDFLTFISILCTTLVIARERSTSENLDRGCSGLLPLLTVVPQHWEAAGSLGIARVKGAPRSARCTPCTARDTKLQSSNLWLNQSLSLSKAHSSVLQFIPDCPFFFPLYFYSAWLCMQD